MKKILFALAFISLTSYAFTQEKGIRFERGLSWSQIKKKAKDEHKYIFMDVFATWCSPCKKMDKEVYSSEQLGTYINDKFISVKVQADSSESDNDEVKKWYASAHQIVSEYKVTAYPSFLFFSPEGKPLSRDLGYKDVTGLIQIATDAQNPRKQYYILLDEFRKDELPYEEMPSIAHMAKSLGERLVAQEIADDYINNYLLKANDSVIFTWDALAFIGDFLGNQKSKSFKLFEQYSQKINAVLGDYQAQSKIMGFIYSSHLPQNLETSKIINWDEVENSVVSEYGSLGQEIVWGQRMMHYLMSGDDWEKYGKYYKLYYERALRHPRRYYINEMSWTLFERVNDLDVLKFAVEVMRYDLEVYDFNVPGAYDTYANLLYKIGRTTEAIEWENKALEMGKGSPEEKSFKQTIEKMKKGQKTWPLNVKKL